MIGAALILPGKFLFLVGRLAAHLLAVTSDRRLAVKLGFRSLAAALALPLMVLLWSLVLSRFWDRSIEERLTYADSRSMAVEVTDASDRYLGIIHYRADPIGDYVDQSEFAAEERRDAVLIERFDIRPDHRAVHLLPDEVPDLYWRCLSYIEDRGAGGLAEPAGIDITTPVRMLLNHRGASTLPMMLSRNLRVQPPRASDPKITTGLRKLREMFEAPSIWRMLGQGPGRGPLRSWSAEHVPLLTSVGSGGVSDSADIYGLETAARLLFGKPASELSPAEQILFAGAYVRPLLPDDPARGDAYTASVRSRWARIIDRAEAICLAPGAHLVDANDVPAIRHELDDLRAHPRGIAIDPAILAAIQSGDQRAPSQTRPTQLEHPYALFLTAVPQSHRRFIGDLLRDRFGANWRDQVRGLRLTTDTPADLAFQTQMSAAWDRFIAANHQGWELEPAQTGKMGFLVAAADDQGKITDYFEGGLAQSPDGTFAVVDGGSAHYTGDRVAGVDPGAEHQRLCTPPSERVQWLADACPFAPPTPPPPRKGRDIASIGKIVAAIALADAGVALTPSLKAAFANSNTDAIAAALAHLHERDLQLLVRELGLTPDPGVPLAYAIASGEMAGSPRTVHRLVAAALAIARGDLAKPIALPTLVDRFDLFDPARLEARTVAAPDVQDEPLNLRALLARPGAPSVAQMAAFVRGALAAPACGGGTLAALSAWCPGGPHHVALLIAKTGTRANGQDKATVDVWIAGGVVFDDGRAFSFIVLAGTDEPNAPFHDKSLNADAAAPLVSQLLSDLEHARAPSTVAPTHSSAPQTGGGSHA